MILAKEIVEHAMNLDLEDIPYFYGAEADLSDPHPKMLDCSEMIEVVCFQAGVRPFMPDGAIWQFRHCVNHDMEISVEDAITTEGALLFWFKSNPIQTRSIGGAHVAISRGNGKTWECRGREWGCGSWSAAGRFNYAALIPGVTYEGF